MPPKRGVKNNRHRNTPLPSPQLGARRRTQVQARSQSRLRDKTPAKPYFDDTPSSPDPLDVISNPTDEDSPSSHTDQFSPETKDSPTRLARRSEHGRQALGTNLQTLEAREGSSGSRAALSNLSCDPGTEFDPNGDADEEDDWATFKDSPTKHIGVNLEFLKSSIPPAPTDSDTSTTPLSHPFRLSLTKESGHHPHLLQQPIPPTPALSDSSPTPPNHPSLPSSSHQLVNLTMSSPSSQQSSAAGAKKTTKPSKPKTKVDDLKPPSKKSKTSRDTPVSSPNPQRQVHTNEIGFRKWICRTSGELRTGQ